MDEQTKEDAQTIAGMLLKEAGLSVVQRTQIRDILKSAIEYGYTSDVIGLGVYRQKLDDFVSAIGLILGEG